MPWLYTGELRMEKIELPPKGHSRCPGGKRQETELGCSGSALSWGCSRSAKGKESWTTETSQGRHRGGRDGEKDGKGRRAPYTSDFTGVSRRPVVWQRQAAGHQKHHTSPQLQHCWHTSALGSTTLPASPWSKFRSKDVNRSDVYNFSVTANSGDQHLFRKGLNQRSDTVYLRHFFVFVFVLKVSSGNRCGRWIVRKTDESQENLQEISFHPPDKGIVLKSGINTYTLLYAKQTRTGNYNQYLLITYNEKESEKEYMCITESLCCTLEMNTTL